MGTSIRYTRYSPRGSGHTLVRSIVTNQLYLGAEYAYTAHIATLGCMVLSASLVLYCLARHLLYTSEARCEPLDKSTTGWLRLYFMHHCGVWTPRQLDELLLGLRRTCGKWNWVLFFLAIILKPCTTARWMGHYPTRFKNYSADVMPRSNRRVFVSPESPVSYKPISYITHWSPAITHPAAQY
jgi:hypothetical protein